MGRIFVFCCCVALSVFVAVDAWAQTEQANPAGLNVSRDSAGQIVVKGSATEPLTKERIGSLEVLSDTQGVDFGPYLKDVVRTVRENWYRLIPEEARPPVGKKGKVAVEFAVKKDGNIDGIRLVASSGDVALDRAAWGGITASNPFPSLPVEFKGSYLALRFRFYYNPDAADLAPTELNEPGPAVVHVVAQTAAENAPDHPDAHADEAPSVLCYPTPKAQTRVEAEIGSSQDESNFGSYLEDNVLPVIRANWYRLVSKSAGKEPGQLTIEFSILKDGSLGAAKVTDVSGNASLEELALAGIEKPSPFRALPAEFSGQSVSVRSHFHYEPDNSAQTSSAATANIANRGAAFLPFCSRNEPTQGKGDCLSPPRVIYSPDPSFSPEARKNKYQGTVTLSIVVAADGSVQSTCTLQSLGYGLDKQAVDAVRQWKFEPASLNGKPMPAQFVVEVDFHLYDKNDGPLPETLRNPMSQVFGAVSDDPPSPILRPCSPKETARNEGNCVTAPQPIRQIPPEYSEKARQAHAEGVVVLMLVVTPSGEPTNIRVTQSLGNGLDEKAIEAVRQWRFQPGTRAGKPVAVEIAVDVSFRLRK